MMEFFDTILYQPLYNLLIVIYNLLPGWDVGFAIIALTILIKGLLWPLTSKSLRGQKALQEIQPKIDALKEECGDDKEKLAKKMMELYSAEKVNPLSSCLPMLIQLPILITLYRVLMSGLEANPADHLYAFVYNPEVVNHMFLGFLDLTEPSIYLALIAGAFQFAQTKMLSARRPPKNLRKKEGAKDEDMLASMNKNMLYFMPVITVVIGASLPGGLTLYWSAVNIVSVIQQFVIFRQDKKENGEKTEIETKEDKK
jgi:YidC/Oxa1 family membrane protein insertase